MQLSHHLMASSFRRSSSTTTSLLLLVLTAASFLFSGVVVVDAFHTGAGQCLVGEASVGAPHMPSTSGDTSLSGNGIAVSVDGTVLDPLTPFTIAAGTDHTLTISATGTTPFKGYLFALSVPSDSSSIDLSTALSPQDTTTGQIASACFAPVVGVTHLNNDTKTSVNATFVLDQDAELALDVTVVIMNKLPFGGVSQYGYAGYQLVNSASASGGSTSSPTAAPAATGSATGAPVALQTTNAPVVSTPSAPAASPSAPSAGSPSSGGEEYYPSSMPAPYSPSAPNAGSPSSGGEEYYPTDAPASGPAPTTPSTGGSSPTAPTSTAGSGKTSGAVRALALGRHSVYSALATGLVTMVLLSGTTMM